MAALTAVTAVRPVRDKMIGLNSQEEQCLSVIMQSKLLLVIFLLVKKGHERNLAILKRPVYCYHTIQSKV